jgi:hypothetical protein
MAIDIISLLLDLLPVVLGGPFLEGLAQMAGMLVTVGITILPLLTLI